MIFPVREQVRSVSEHGSVNRSDLLSPLRLGLLPLSIGAIVATTMIPIKLRWPSLTFLDTSIDRSDVTNNILLYLPLGVSLVRAGLPRCIAFAAGLSVLAEALQFGYVSRDPSPVDVASNVTGALVGFVLAWLVWKATGFVLESIKIGRLLAALCLTVGAVSVFALAWHRTLADFSNWDSRFPLAVENELTGDKPWRGTIEKLAIYASSLKPSLTEQFAARGPDAPMSGSKDSLPTAIYATSNVPGAPANCAQKLLTPDENVRLFETLRRTGQLTILVWMTPENVTQTGPARIVTSSHDLYRRNFTLGQMGRTLTFRLRTPNTGGNGMDPALYTPPVLSAGRQSFIAVTYDGAVSKIYVEGKLVARANLASRRPRFPYRLLRILPPSLPVPDLETNICEIVIGSLAAMGLLGLLGVSTQRRRDIWRWACIAGAVPGALIWIFCASEPMLGLRVLLLSLGGALLVAFASEWPSSQTTR
ncbi:MAG: VanZ family protein [Bryobacteraceae bacterium]